MSEDTC